MNFPFYFNILHPRTALFRAICPFPFVDFEAVRGILALTNQDEKEKTG
jgi:hypothetical protein